MNAIECPGHSVRSATGSTPTALFHPCGATRHAETGVGAWAQVVDGDHHTLLVLYGEDADSTELAGEVMEVAMELADHKGLLMTKINAEAAPEIAEKFGATECAPLHPLSPPRTSV